MFVRYNMKKTLILDSNNLLYRIFFMNRARGTDVNTLLVFLRCVRSYVDMLDGVDQLIAVWDSRLQRGQPNFRRLAKEADYKGNRDHEGLEEAHVYDEQIQKSIEALGGINMFPNRMEADDVIAWLAHNITDHQLTIVTVDQDMYQLVNENVNVYSPIKKITVNDSNFESITGVPKHQFLQYKALIGDKSDNIPGVPRVGKKTAVKILEKGIQETLPEEHIEIYNNNIKLMDLSYGYTVHDHEIEKYQEQFEHINDTTKDIKQLKNICVHNAVYSISNDIDNWFKPFQAQENNVPNVVNLINSLNINK